jgi:hypothetical protein
MWSGLCLHVPKQINMFKRQEALALAEAVRETQFINVENGAYLNSTLPCLPNGIIDKTYTGIGGTSLELDCERDSVVVVPYNNIADAKASKLSVSRYYETHKYKKSNNNKSNSRLHNYLARIKSKDQYMKIICVNDQLVDLKSELIATGKKFEEVFILFDEIDSMQEQSSFRSVMDNCMDVYLAHTAENRAMITATLRDFTHPSLKDEPRHKVVSMNRPKDVIDVISTDSGMKELLLQIKAKLALDDHKVVIACNHLVSALSLADTIKEDLPRISIGILCSSNSKKSAGEYYNILDKKGILPCRVNIITAALFNGCDILEPYHSIVYSSISAPSLQLSPSTVYQISGRCRLKLVSNTLIIQSGPRWDDYVYYKEDKLIGFAKQHAFINNTLNSMVPELDDIGIAMLRGFHGSLVEGYKGVPSLSRKVDDLTSVVSYFKIDQRIIEQRTSKLMENAPDYIDAIEEMFDVQILNSLYVDQAVKLVELDKKGKLSMIIDELKELLAVNSDPLSNADLLQFRAGYRSLGLKEFDLMMDSFELAMKHNWDMEKLLSKAESCAQAPKSLAQMKKLYSRLLWCSYEGNSDLLRVATLDMQLNESYDLRSLKQKEKGTVERLENYKAFTPKDFHVFRALIKSKPSLLRDVLFITEESKNRVHGKHTRMIKLVALAPQNNPFL